MSIIAYSYIRFSSSKQEHGDSLRRQTSLTESYCQRHGLILDDSLRLHDLGVSGFTGRNSKTGALSRFTLAIEEGRVAAGSILIVENLDRLSREQVLDALHTFRTIVKAGVKVVTLKPEREYTVETVGDDYVMMEAIFDMMRAHRESKRKSDLGKSAWSGKRDVIGVDKLTGQVPAWIRIVNRHTVGNRVKGGDFKVIEPHAVIVRQIFALAIQGHGLTVITKRLNGQVESIGRGKVWSPSYLSKILHNRAVMGEFQPRTGRPGQRQPIGEVIPNYYPMIVNEHDFYAAQSGLKGRLNARGRTGEHVRNLFTGLLIDAKDRSPLNVVHKDTVRLYSAASIRGEPGSSSVGFPYHAFEGAVLEYLKEVKPSDLDDNARSDDTTILHVRLTELDVKIEAVNQAIIDNPSITSLIPTLGKLDGQRREVMANIEATKSRQHDVPNLDDLRTTIEMMASASDKVEVRTRIKARIRQVVESIHTLFLPTGIRKERLAIIQVNLRNGTFRRIFAHSSGSMVGTVIPMSFVDKHFDLRTENGVHNLSLIPTLK